MATSTCLNQRLLLAILRPSAPVHSTTVRVAPTGHWVRYINSSSSRYQEIKFVPLGVESDTIVVQNFDNGGSKDSNSLDTKRVNLGDKKKADSSKWLDFDKPADEYVIEDFVDRSSPTLRPTTGSSNMPMDEAGHVQQNSLDVLTGKRRVRGEKEKNLGRKTLPSAKKVDLANAQPPSQPRKSLEPWQTQRNALKQKFSEGWNPRKKLSPDAQEGIRGLHQQDPAQYSTSMLAEQFKVSPEAIRRILKSKWMSKQDPEKMEERRQRWAKRHDNIWDQQAELGLRPQRRKEMMVEDPDQFEHEIERKRILGEMK